MKVNLNGLEWKMTIVGASRYYMGRHTIAVSGFCDGLIKLIPDMSEDITYILERDIRSYLEEHPDGDVFACVDDAEPWRKVLNELERRVNAEA